MSHIKLKAELLPDAKHVSITILKGPTHKEPEYIRRAATARVEFSFGMHHNIELATRIFYDYSGSATNHYQLYFNVHSPDGTKRTFVPSVTLAQWEAIKLTVLEFNGRDKKLGKS